MNRTKVLYFDAEDAARKLGLETAEFIARAHTISTETIAAWNRITVKMLSNLVRAPLVDAPAESVAIIALAESVAITVAELRACVSAAREVVN